MNIPSLAGAPLPALPFVVCDAVGRILRTGSAPGDLVPLQSGAGESVFAGSADPINDYIANVTTAPTATARPESPVTLDKTSVAADATDTVTLSNVAAGAAISITGPASGGGTGDGNPVHLTFAAPGVYRIRVSHFPDRDFEATVYAA